MKKNTHYLFFVCLILASALWVGCEGCEETKRSAQLSLPFTDNFNRPQIGTKWWTNRPGRWNIKYNSQTKQGQLCVESARNNHLFLQARLPRNVSIEFDAWAREKDGDVKAEIFSDGRYNKTGYVLVHGGWSNSISIIDRLDEHNKDRRVRRNKDGSPMVIRNKKYHWKITRIGSKVTWYLNGKHHLTYDDTYPLTGKGHEHFAFGNWIARVCYDNVHIRAIKNPIRAIAQPTRTLPKPVKAPVDPAPQPVDPVQDPPSAIQPPLRPVAPAPEKRKPALKMRPSMVKAVKQLRRVRRTPHIIQPRLQLKSKKHFILRAVDSPRN